MHPITVKRIFLFLGLSIVVHLVFLYGNYEVDTPISNIHKNNRQTKITASLQTHAPITPALLADTPPPQKEAKEEKEEKGAKAATLSNAAHHAPRMYSRSYGNDNAHPKLQTPAIDDSALLSKDDLTNSLKTDLQGLTHQALLSATSQTTLLSAQALASADIEMAVTYTKVNESPIKGVGRLRWENHDSHYQLSLQIEADLFITKLNILTIESQGTINEYGLAPQKVTDKRRGKSATTIHFDHDAKTMTFSSSNKTIPMLDGAQDAVSVLFQLGAIGKANPEHLAPNKDWQIQVAEGRDANEFHFTVASEESLEIQLNNDAPSRLIKTLHIIRPPKAGSYHSKIEVWLAPELGWYPARIRNTESNGTVTEQNITKIHSYLLH